MSDPVAVRLDRLGLGRKPEPKAKVKKTHVLEKQPNLKVTKTKSKKVKK